jgi:hypothetical protein
LFCARHCLIRAVSASTWRIHGEFNGEFNGELTGN